MARVRPGPPPFLLLDTRSYLQEYGGAGLGLSISKRLASPMQANMWVESEGSKGSRFFPTIVSQISQNSIESTLSKMINGYPANVKPAPFRCLDSSREEIGRDGLKIFGERASHMCFRGSCGIPCTRLEASKGAESIWEKDCMVVSRGMAGRITRVRDQRVAARRRQERQAARYWISWPAGSDAAARTPLVPLRMESQCIENMEREERTRRIEPWDLQLLDYGWQWQCNGAGGREPGRRAMGFVRRPQSKGKGSRAAERKWPPKQARRSGMGSPGRGANWLWCPGLGWLAAKRLLRGGRAEEHQVPCGAAGTS
jgi:hypothetical protein